MAGETNLMEFAELSDVEKLRQLFEVFNRKRDFLHLLDQCARADGVQIFIGKESGYEPLDDCSVVSAPYAVDDEGLVFLSTTDRPEQLKKICGGRGGTKNKLISKKPNASDPIHLKKGKRYYIVAYLKEGGGADWLQVGWRGPGIDEMTVIEGKYLSSPK